MLITPIKPKTIASPNAANSKTEPTLSPLKIPSKIAVNTGLSLKNGEWGEAFRWLFFDSVFDLVQNSPAECFVPTVD
jgi:hypothetical protein